MRVSRRHIGASLTATLTGASVLLALVGVAAHDPITTRVTWARDVSRIVHARCIRCHSPDGRAPMSLATYEAARPWAKAIKEEVLTRRMPKWHAARGYGEFSNDPSLSPTEIALIAAWADGGAPKGTEPDSPPAPPAPWIERLAAPAGARDVTLACGVQPLPQGTLLAVRPAISPGADVGIGMRRPGRSPEIIAWIRGYDPKFPETYWLSVPLMLGPGAHIETTLTKMANGTASNDQEPCSVTVAVLPPR